MPEGELCLCAHDIDLPCGKPADGLCSCCDSPICQSCMNCMDVGVEDRVLVPWRSVVVPVLQQDGEMV